MIIVLPCTRLKMESHTLEILQQGVWASLTGGWFYDFRQNVFCNTFHLYLWLFLLCFPFILHLYFTPSLFIGSFYCITISVLFTVIKLINHKLHVMFDTCECIEEPVPGEDLPESQKRKTLTRGSKTALEDEGIELQVLKESKSGDLGFSSSFNEPTDDDSVMSLELGSRGLSNAIDLQVDVHQKNSSESSEDISLKPVAETSLKIMKEAKQTNLLDSQLNSAEIVESDLKSRHKQFHNNKLKLKPEEGILRITNDEFALSQSDCHIAKFRKKSMDDLNEEYKMSQSDCQISNLRQSSENFHQGENDMSLSPSLPKHVKIKASAKRIWKKNFEQNLSAQAQTEKILDLSEKNIAHDIGSSERNDGSEVLVFDQCFNLIPIKNTGSLELPLKDIENSSCAENGLLYWKQQNLSRARGKKRRQLRNNRFKEKLKIRSEDSIHSPEKSNEENIKKISINAPNFDNKENLLDHPCKNCKELENSTFLSQEENSKHDNAKEKSFLKILEENFDWYSSEYQNEKPEKLIRMQIKIKDISKYKSDENIREGYSTEKKPILGLKFQVDSDEDSSDNCGSRSPLLCHPESLKKCTNSSDESCLAKKCSKTESTEEKKFQRFNTINGTSPTDENMILNIKRIEMAEKQTLPFSSDLKYEEENICGKDGDDADCMKTKKKPEVFSNLGKPIFRQESFLHRNKKLSLPLVTYDSNKTVENFQEDTSILKKESAKDLFSLANERVGLDWLFEHPDSETDIVKGHYDYCHNSHSSDFLKNTPQMSKESKILQGAIPKTRIKNTEISRKNNYQCNPHITKKKSTAKSDLKEEEVLDLENAKTSETTSKKKGRTEQESGFICEQAPEVTEVQQAGHGRETYDSSSSSATELSSLLPLSSLLSSLHPPSSPLLAAFLASRREIIRNSQASCSLNEPTPYERELETKEKGQIQSMTFSRNPQKRSKRSNRAQRSSRSPKVSSFPSNSFVSAEYKTHIATSYDDTSQGAVHRFQDEKGNWISYTFDNRDTTINHSAVPLQKQTECDTGKLNYANSNVIMNCSLYPVKSNIDDRDDQNGSKFFSFPPKPPHASAGTKLGVERELNISTFNNSHKNEENSLGQQDWGKTKQDRELKAQDVHVRYGARKSSGPWDSNINLASNSNSENDSSLSLNSTPVTPNVEVGVTRPTFTSFVRERFLASQQPGSGSNNARNSTSNSNSCILNLNEFRNNNNNINTIASYTTTTTTTATTTTIITTAGNNNNNNNSSINNLDNRSGHRYNFYSDGILGNSVPLRSPFGLITESFLERRSQRTTFNSPAIRQDSQLSVIVAQHVNEQENERTHFRLFDFDDVEPSQPKNKPKHYYKLYYTPWNFLKIRFDRLELLALLDRNLTIFEILLSLILSVGVSVCGIIILNSGFYRDLFAFLFCFSMAGCQYSLLKSVQPDATSPTHGYNRVVIYSRPVYFCATCLLILFLSENLNKNSDYSFQIYNLQLANNNLIRAVRDVLIALLLLFPVLFTLGLFPQVNTFCLYLLEQIDMHVFGGNAMSSLVGALYCILRSLITSLFVYGFAYGALSEAKGSQHILYSIFSGLLISLSYHLSRSSSNPSIVWEILKNYLFQDEFLDKKYSKELIGKKIKKYELDKSVDESFRSEINMKNEGDEKSDDRISHNNLLLNSNPSSNEMLKTTDSQLKSTCSENFDNLGSASEIENDGKDKEKEEFVDPLPGKLKQTVNDRLKNDVIVCGFVAILVFGIHCSTVFTALQPDLNPILWGIAGCSGIVLHYVVPELRKHLPWLCLAKPILKCHEHGQFEVKDVAKIMWFEETYVILRFLEKNILYPVLVLAALTYDGPKICRKLGVPVGAFVTSVCGLKVMRSAFSNTSQQYLIVIFSALLFEFDYHSYSETFLVDYFFMGILFAKTYEFLLKVQFVVIYIAPWQITWGSAFHAFAQPFSVPHSAMLFVQAALSAILSAPLNPFLGSAIFLASYVRPIKFWERDYNTKRVDHSNTRLSSHLERNLGSDDNNLNSIFYEHLTRSLQHSLCGDLELGRWGPVYQGDCFVLASDYLNCLVHIIEVGNGLVTFQMRGLEFRGTYCQQREVEAISERIEQDDGCCCCEPGHIPHILSANAAFSKRWLAWEVTATKYVLEGYSISDNSAASTLQAFDFRKVLVTYYVKSIIFYCVSSPKLQSWLTNPIILSALEPLSDRSFVDLDPIFNVNIDQDFDIRSEGITRNSFCSVYLEWINYCCAKREKPLDKSLESSLITLCLALSLMGRRSLGTASHNTVSSVEFFLYGLHALFKGDFRITSTRDDWVFADMEFLVKVVAPGVRMSLKLHQDHFMSPEEYQDPGALFEAISNHEQNLVISHEGDPVWRSAVLSGTPSLLALRHVLDDGTDEYKIIMLNKRFLTFRVIKLNRECVRGLWSGQQQELVFLRNRNPERGSIQNAKQVLRNMINSSCDQPIGYPIYVSPLTTSYADTNAQLTGIIGGPLSFRGMKESALKVWRRIRQRCREGCSSGSAGNMDDGGYSLTHEGVYTMTNINSHSGYGHNTSGSQSMDSSQMQLGSSNRGGSLGRSSLGGRGSLPSVGKPSSNTLASLAGLLSSADLPKGEGPLRERETSFTFVKEKQNREEKDTPKRFEEKKEEKEKKKEEKEKEKENKRDKEKIQKDMCEETKDKESAFQRVRIIDPNFVFDAINLGRRIDVLWPDEGMRVKGGRSYWKDWLPDTGMEGQVVHRWVPNHRDPSKRSNVDKTILLIKIEDKYVPIAEAGVQDLGVEV